MARARFCWIRPAPVELYHPPPPPPSHLSPPKNSCGTKDPVHPAKNSCGTILGGGTAVARLALFFFLGPSKVRPKSSTLSPLQAYIPMPSIPTGLKIPPNLPILSHTIPRGLGMDACLPRFNFNCTLTIEGSRPLSSCAGEVEEGFFKEREGVSDGSQVQQDLHELHQR